MSEDRTTPEEAARINPDESNPASENEVNYLTKEQILEADDLPREDVLVEEWNGTVTLKTLSGLERDHFENMIEHRKQNGKMNMLGVKVQFLARIIVDKSGEPLFTKTDLAALNKKSSKAINELFEKGCQMSGILDKDVKELAENLDKGPSEDSGFDSLDS